MTDWITLNVGGTKFTTTRSVLTSDPDSMLARMFEHEGSMEPAAKDKDGAYLIDGNPKYFEPILNFLRRGELVIDPGVSQKGVLLEAKYLGIQSLVSRMEEENEKNSKEVKVGSFVSITDEDREERKGIVTKIDNEKAYFCIKYYNDSVL